MRLWALVTSALRMMKVSPCVGGCHVRGSPLLPPGRSVPGGVGGNGALLSGSRLWEILRKGGLSEGFPPPSLRGRERKPNWTIATRSVRCGTLKAGRHSGRSRTWSPRPSFPSCSASPAIGGMGDGKSGFIVPRGLTVSASGWNCPCRRGFGAFLPPGFEPWCDEEGPPP